MCSHQSARSPRPCELSVQYGSAAARWRGRLLLGAGFGLRGCGVHTSLEPASQRGVTDPAPSSPTNNPAGLSVRELAREHTGGPNLPCFPLPRNGDGARGDYQEPYLASSDWRAIVVALCTFVTAPTSHQKRPQYVLLDHSFRCGLGGVDGRCVSRGRPLPLGIPWKNPNTASHDAVRVHVCLLQHAIASTPHCATPNRLGKACPRLAFPTTASTRFRAGDATYVLVGLVGIRLPCGRLMKMSASCCGSLRLCSGFSMPPTASKRELTAPNSHPCPPYAPKDHLGSVSPTLTSGCRALA